ncbi:MAG: Ig-like domain-containing protein [Thaumarchaeota archaeon]|nr:Ig-like domain-containing protein [Nitrososphaerota archaeon]
MRGHKDHGSALLAVGLVLCFLISVVLSGIPTAFAAKKVTAAGVPYALGLQVVPSKLPSDGATYASLFVTLLDSTSRPSIAASYVSVYLSSSQENIATVVPTLIIQPGSNYATANITTTVTPGNAVITASSPGLLTASVVASTAVPSGFPSQLKVFLSPATVLAQPNVQGSLIVELLDQKGQPTKSPTDIIVSLSSSNTRVVNVSQSSIVLKAGKLEVASLYTSSYIPGKARITAASAGLAAGSGTLTVTGPSPQILHMYAQPNKIPISTSGKLSIVLSDSTGNPARAPNDITVYLSSTNTSVAKVPSSVVVRGGSILVEALLNTTAHPGSVTITASSTNLVTTSTTLRSFVPVLTPAKLKLELSPPIVLADGSSYDAGVLSLQNSLGSPAESAAAVTVQLTSSNTKVGTVPLTVTFPPNRNFVRVVFSTSFLSGSTAITASGNNLLTDQVSISTFGPVPVKLALSVLASSNSLPADGLAYQVLQVALTDSVGGPAPAPVDVSVQLLSASSGVVSVDSSITIPAGSFAAVETVSTSPLPGKSNISSLAQGFSSAGVSITTQIPAPYTLAGLIAPTPSVLSEVATPPMFGVQLRDSLGNPTRAALPTQVLVTSSNAKMIPLPFILTVPQGADHLLVPLNVPVNGTTILTLSAPGLKTSSVHVDIRGPSQSVTVTPKTSNIFTNGSVNLVATVKVEGQPISGVTVSWNATLGRLDSNTSLTSTLGTATNAFRPTQTGLAKITVTFSSPAIGTIVLTPTVTVSAIPPRATPSLLQVLLGYLIFVVPVVAVALGVFLFLQVRKRRQKAREELEAGFQTLT